MFKVVASCTKVSPLSSHRPQSAHFQITRASSLLSLSLSFKMMPAPLFPQPCPSSQPSYLHIYTSGTSLEGWPSLRRFCDSCARPCPCYSLHRGRRRRSVAFGHQPWLPRPILCTIIPRDRRQHNGPTSVLRARLVQP
jgi:hypothetical protein